MAVTAAEPTFEMYDLKQALIKKNRLMGLVRMMRGYRLHYAGAIIALAISALARTASLLLIGWFVDDLLTPQQTVVQVSELSNLALPAATTLSPDLPTLLPLVALAFLLLSMLQGSFSYFSGRWSSYTAEKVAWRARNYLFDHLQRLSFSYHDRMQTGELLQRSTSDVEAIRRFYVEQGVGIGRIVILFVVNLVAIMTINMQLALLSVVVIPVLIVVSLYFFGRISKKYDEFQEEEARLSTTLQENLSGVRVVKAFARQEYERDKFEGMNWSRFKRGRELLALNAIYWPLTDLLTGIQLVFGFFIAAVMMLDGTITVGDYIAYAGVIGTLINPMRQLGRLIVHAAQGMGSFTRIMELVEAVREDLGEDREVPVKDIKGEIVFENVSFQYDNETPVLHDISFSVQPGQTIALLGSTGSGKTSLVALLPRFYEYTSGRILLDGVDLKDYPKAYLRENIGVVEQEPFLFSRSIRENITYGVGREVPDEEVFAAARAAAVHDVIESFPDGYQTMVGERGVTLSGGQKQRVALARTLLKNPRILILDDATSSVDTETEAAIRQALRGQAVPRTMFVIAHRVTTLMNADLILVMDNGRIVQTGTHAELIAQDGIYRETFEMQSRIDEELERELADV
ncbi:MAG: ABC transporter ATP-binding protein [Chloroflexota bacterium]